MYNIFGQVHNRFNNKNISRALNMADENDKLLVMKAVAI